MLAHLPWLISDVPDYPSAEVGELPRAAPTAEFAELFGSCTFSC